MSKQNTPIILSLREILLDVCFLSGTRITWCRFVHIKSRRIWARHLGICKRFARRHGFLVAFAEMGATLLTVNSGFMNKQCGPQSRSSSLAYLYIPLQSFPIRIEATSKELNADLRRAINRGRIRVTIRRPCEDPWGEESERRMGRFDEDV